MGDGRMRIMVLGSMKMFSEIVNELNEIDVAEIYFCNFESEAYFGALPAFLTPFTDLVVCEASRQNLSRRECGELLLEAERMRVPVLTETALFEILSD